MTERRRLPENIVQQRLEAMAVHMRGLIAKRGYAEQHVGGSKMFPPWSYTIGLSEPRVTHPEIVIVGVPMDLASFWFSQLYGHITQGGRRFDREMELEADDLVPEYPVAFRVVNRMLHDDLFGMGHRVLRRPIEKVVQLVWCDKDRQWPWQWPPERRMQRQPVLDDPTVELLAALRD